MADRTSAAIFGWLFTELAKRPAANRELAKTAYIEAQGYDFNECQMECGDELVELGLAKLVPSEDDPGWKEYEYADKNGNLA